jgi:hypothetical protein
VWRWRKRGGVLLWALPRGESGRAKGITNAASMIFKPKHGKGEEGGLARRCHTVGKGGGREGMRAHVLSGGATLAQERWGWVMLRC